MNFIYHKYKFLQTGDKNKVDINAKWEYEDKFNNIYICCNMHIVRIRLINLIYCCLHIVRIRV